MVIAAVAVLITVWARFGTAVGRPGPRELGYCGIDTLAGGQTVSLD